MTDLTVLTDEALRRYYEQIREQVAADTQSGDLRFMGSEAKARADLLLGEIQRRGLNITPIPWQD
jgi:hypothetical protein